jgi:hypothetical protein
VEAVRLDIYQNRDLSTTNVVSYKGSSSIIEHIIGKEEDKKVVLRDGMFVQMGGPALTSVHRGAR